MTKKRLHEVSKELDIDNKVVIDFLFNKGITNKEGGKLTASSNLDSEHIELVKKSLEKLKPVEDKPKELKPRAKATEKKEVTTTEKKVSIASTEKTIKIKETELNKIDEKAKKKETTTKHIEKESITEDTNSNVKVEKKEKDNKEKDNLVVFTSSKFDKLRSVSLAVKERVSLKIQDLSKKTSSKNTLKTNLLGRVKTTSPLLLIKEEVKVENKPEKKKQKASTESQEPYKKKIKELGSNEPPKELKEEETQKAKPRYDDKRTPYVPHQTTNRFERGSTAPLSTTTPIAPQPVSDTDKPKKFTDNKKKGRDTAAESRRKRQEEEKLLAKAIVSKRKKKDDRRSEEIVEENLNKEVEIYDGMTVKDIADKLRLKETEIIRDLFMKGIMVTLNQALDKEMVTKIVLEKGFTIKEDTSKENELLEMKLQQLEEAEHDLIVKAPVVTIMGHVDHGKTSLLDAIRKTKVTDSEAGGITQHIGAYQVIIHGRPITFLDTPGHEAFTALRARGAKATDIAILVVAADDGVMPQTIEAIHHAKAASVPVIVAINKMDKPDSNPDRIKQQLAEHDLVPEDWGGTTVMVPVSARAKTGIDDLLEMILLTADIQDFKTNPNKQAQGVIIEAKLDKGKGAIATVLIQSGTLKVGDNFVVGSVYGKVRAMFNYLGKNIKEAGPSVPVQVIGYSGVPVAGELFKVVDNDKMAKETAEKVLFAEKEKANAPTRTLNLESISEQIAEGKAKELNIVIKADAQGSAEALEQSLSKVIVEDVKLRIIHSAVGDVTESDVTLATASKGIVIAFNVKADAKTKELAEKEGIDIRNYNIIYRVIEDIQKALEGLLEPEYEEVMTGKIEVRALFNIGKSVIAGCYVTEGKIARNATIKVFRAGKLIHTGKIDALKRFKDDVKEVLTGFECGVSLEKFNTLEQGDIFEGYITQEKTR